MDESDRISDLPEDVIIHHMFNSLTTKEAVQTCLISRKWLNLWTCAPHLHFDEDDFDVYDFTSAFLDDEVDFLDEDAEIGSRQTDKFVHFINTVLDSHDTASTLDKFQLVYINSSIFIELACNISNWITHAMMRNVRELVITAGSESCRTPIELPACLFNSESLQVLNLKFIDTYVVFPASINLPNLKHLCLDHLYFVSTRNSTDHSQLSSAIFPSLEVLVLHYCNWYLVDSFTISAPILESLSVKVHAAHFRAYEFGKCMVVNISAPSLRILTCLGLFSFDYSLIDNFSSHMVRACLKLSTLPLRDLYDEYNGPMRNFLNIVARNVKELELSESAVQLLYGLGSFPLPTLYNLESLMLTASGTDKGKKMGFIFRLLYHSPMLRCLSINFCGEGSAPKILIVLQNYVTSIPEKYMRVLNSGVLKHLKVVSIYNLVPNKTEIWFINFLLENAWALEQMTIGLRRMDLAQMMLIQLSYSPRVSRCCLRDGQNVDLFFFKDKLNGQVQADGVSGNKRFKPA